MARAWADHGVLNHRVATKQGEQKARQVPMQVLEGFTVLIPSGQQTDVVIKAKNLTISYRNLLSEMLRAQEQV